MHPVTAHGYNLGLSGQQLLAQAVLTARHQGQDIGTPKLLQQYSQRHRRVVLPMYLGTNTLVDLYTTENLPTKILRKALLHAANHLPLIRRVVTDRLVSH
jgi:2-polyprenyl-6-methoxyphenol hydroxylase-like FAD-dependent oxidoreductase